MLHGCGGDYREEAELARLRAVLDVIPRGAPSAALIEGPSGIGKTALWREASTR